MAKKTAPKKDLAAKLTAPLQVMPTAEFALHLDIRLSREQSVALRRLVAGLDAEQATVPCGRPQSGGQRRITANAAGDAVRWLLQQLYDKSNRQAVALADYLATTTTPPPSDDSDSQADASETSDAPQPEPVAAATLEGGTTGPPDFLAGDLGASDA